MAKRPGIACVCVYLRYPPPLPKDKSTASNEIITSKSIAAPTEHRHPWRRYFARIFDIYVFAMLGSFGIGLLFPSLFDNSDQKQNDAVLNIALVAAYVPFEAFCLYAFGTTIGKSLYKIKLMKVGRSITLYDGLRRAFAVWLKGMGAGIPIVTLFTLISAYNTLKSRGATSWDAQYDWRVSHGAIRLYLGETKTRKSLGLMTRKLSVTESQNSAHRLGTFSRRKVRMALENSR